MRSGDFCKYKACGKLTNHISGYCHRHNKQWLAGYRYALKELSGQQPTEAGTGREVSIVSGGEMSDESGRDNYSQSFQFTFGREGEGDESLGCQDGLGVSALPQLVGSGNGSQKRKTESLGCGICQTD